MLISGSESDDCEHEWLQLISNLNSTVNASSTVALYACIIDVNKEPKIQEFAKNEWTCWLGHKQQPCCTTITSDHHSKEGKKEVKIFEDSKIYLVERRKRNGNGRTYLMAYKQEPINSILKIHQELAAQLLVKVCRYQD